ncbi:MAG TPA: hypothetical protein GXZ26_08070 [Firmicutes bacterium]|nr:hypothetical protein [Bacillota bacterium]
MKKVLFPMIMAILLLLLSVSVFGNILANNRENGEDIQYEYGIVVINGEPAYFDPQYLDNPDVFISPDYAKNIESDIIKGGKLYFDSDESIVIVEDVKKEQLGSAVAYMELKYKVENRTLYLSEDGENWEAVIFRVIDDKKHVDKYDPSITIYWVVYLECKWFKGEYEIISIPNA